MGSFKCGHRERGSSVEWGRGCCLPAGEAGMGGMPRGQAKGQGGGKGGQFMRPAGGPHRVLAFSRGGSTPLEAGLDCGACLGAGGGWSVF